MTGRVNILWRIKKKTQKSQNWSQRTQKKQFFWKFLGEIYQNNVFPFFWPNFLLFCIFLKNAPVYTWTLPVILSFMKFCVAQTCLVKFHLDDVLKVLLVVRKNLFFLQNLYIIINHHRKIHWKSRKQVIEVPKSSIWKL